MILVARLFLIVEIDKALLFAPFFNLRLVYLPSDVLHVQKEIQVKTTESQRLHVGSSYSAVCERVRV